MTYAIENGYAAAHEHAFEEAQRKYEERLAYEAFIDAECADVLKRQAAYPSLMKTAIECCTDSDYWDSVSAVSLALMAGNLRLAEQHLEAARPFLEKEIKSLLVVETPLYKWRKENMELSYEY